MPSRKSKHGSRRTLRGTAALEFGLAVPLLAILLTAIVEIGFSMYQAMQTNYAAEAGLAYAAKNGWDATGIASAVTGSTGLSGMTATPTQFCGCSSYTGIANATCGTTCSSGQTAGQYIKVSVSLTRMSIIGTTGFGLPASFSAQSILRQN
jgi:Flp pilus assembly protein TadG